MSQREGSEQGYGQGALAYAKRYGAYFADGTIENSMVSTALPSFLHQDPLISRRVKGISAPNGICHHPDRHDARRQRSKQFNFSAVSAALSTNLHYPVGDRALPNTLGVWGRQVGYDTLTLIVKEFWPDLRRKMHHSKIGPELK